MVILNELPHVLQCFIHMKSHFLEKKPGTSLWEISISCTIQERKNVIQHLIIEFLLYLYLSSNHLQRLERKENFNLSSLKVVMVSCER